MRRLKIFGVACLIAGAAMLGDSCNVNDKFINPIRYRNVKVDPKNYQKPFKLQKRYVQNERGMLEVHLGHDEKWYKVSNELRVNERSLDQMLKDHGNEVTKMMKQKYEQNEPIIKGYLNKIIEIYKDIFRVEDGNNQ